MFFFLIAGLALFFPRKEEQPAADAPGKREKIVYSIMSCVCLGLAVMYQMKLFPALASWMDNMMGVLFQFTGGRSA